MRRMMFTIAVLVAILGSPHTPAWALQTSVPGTVWAWGWNDVGQLGDGTTTDRLTPVLVSGLSGVSAVAAGGDHSLALKWDGTVWAWGHNDYGQVGSRITPQILTPVPVSGLSGVSAVAAGSWHSMALKSDRTVWAWGSNDLGELGDGTTWSSWTPVRVSGLFGVTAVAARDDHNLAVVNGLVTRCTTMSQILGNTGFETGTLAPWSSPSTVSLIDGNASPAAHSGRYKASLKGGTVTRVGTVLTGFLFIIKDDLWQTVTIPVDACAATLSFWLWTKTSTPGRFIEDKLTVTVRDTSGRVLATLAGYSGLDATSSYVEKRFDLMRFAGQTIRVQFADTQEMLDTNFLIDDVTLNVLR